MVELQSSRQKRTFPNRYEKFPRSFLVETNRSKSDVRCEKPALDYFAFAFSLARGSVSEKKEDQQRKCPLCEGGHRSFRLIAVQGTEKSRTSFETDFRVEERKNREMSQEKERVLIPY